jgi:hypothetical protein
MNVLQVCVVLAWACPHVLHVPSLSRSSLKDTCARPDGDHDSQAARRYLFTLIARSLLLLPTGHMAVPELSCATRREPRPHDTWRSRSCHGLWWRELEPWGTWRLWSCPVSRDGSRGTHRHVAVPELPRALVAGAGGTWRLQSCPVPGDGSRETRVYVRLSYLSSLTWSLYTWWLETCIRGIQSLGYRQTCNRI